jgi:ketosteroid isomerase-like protein
MGMLRWMGYRVLNLLSIIAALLLAGCASAPKTDPRGDDKAATAQIERRLQEIFDAAEKKEMERLDSYHLYGPGFTKFTSERADRLDAEETRKGEHEALIGASGLKMQAEGLKIDVLGETAVATFILNYSVKSGADTIQKKARSTLVFVKEQGWKIVHEHFSTIQPRP